MSLPSEWEHQREGFERAKDRPWYAFLFEPGTGKSRTVINVLRRHFNEKRRVLRTLIFAPKVVVPNWRDEWLKYSAIEPKHITLLAGSGKQRLAKLQTNGFRENLPHGHIFVANYESLLMPDVFEAMAAWLPEVLIFDESHLLKSGQAKRSKLADELANPYDKSKKPYQKLPKPLTYLLTGTPVLNSPMDIFMQWRVMDGGAAFGENFFAFRARYFRDRNAGMPKQRYFPKWEIMSLEKDGFDALREINVRLGESSMHVKKRECMDLPPEVDTIIKVGMTKEQARIYNEMKQDLIAFIKNQAVVATLAITKIQRLQQIASGYAKVANGDVIDLEDTPKMEALRELLEKLSPTGKVIIWAVYHQNYKQIAAVCKSLGLGYVEVHGEAKGKSQDAVDRFRNDPNCHVYIGHPGSGGIGINLIEAPYAIFYSRTTSLGEYEQARARNYRGGSEIHEKITYYHLVCENTIDEIVLKKLASKVELSDKILSQITYELLAESAST